jgi:hypothetical protein
MHASPRVRAGAYFFLPTCSSPKSTTTSARTSPPDGLDRWRYSCSAPSPPPSAFAFGGLTLVAFGVAGYLAPASCGASDLLAAVPAPRARPTWRGSSRPGSHTLDELLRSEADRGRPERAVVCLRRVPALGAARGAEARRRLVRAPRSTRTQACAVNVHQRRVRRPGDPAGAEPVAAGRIRVHGYPIVFFKLTN